MSQNLYSIVNNTNASLKTYIVVSHKNNRAIWNTRLGHVHFKVVHHILALCNIKLNNKHFVDFCNACCLEKSHRLHTSLTQIKYCSSFELVHIDLSLLEIHVFCCGFTCGNISAGTPANFPATF